jgi:phospholipid/cholesterol/gamma-HCH transport system substrate-binding protein
VLHSTLVRFQLVFFTVVAVIGVGYAAFAYAGIQRQTGIGMYTVTTELEDTGGLYVNALVTYRGVKVGTVTDVGLRSPGARAELQISSDYKIPADLDARVRSISAVGEQFVDLIPRTGDGPRLKDGDVIAADRTHIPVATTTVIEDVRALLQAVPKDDLDTTLREASTTLTGMGRQLNTGLSAATRVVDRASRNLDPTLRLIDSAQRPLTQIAQSDKAIDTFSRNLASFTQQLTMSDGAVRLALDTGDGFFDSASSLMQDLTPTAGVLLSNLQSVG